MLLSRGLGDAEETGAVPYQDLILYAIRSLPPCATGKQLVQMLAVAQENVPNSTYGWQAVNDAVNAPKTQLGIEIPFWPWSDTPMYCAGSPQRDGAINLMTEFAGNASANEGAEQVLEQAKSDLATELSHPLDTLKFNLNLPDWFFPALATAGAVGVGAWVYFGLLRPVSKLARATNPRRRRRRRR